MSICISVEIEGKQYAGSYTVNGNLVTVTSAYGQKSTQRGGLQPETIAKMMLRELIQESPDRA